MFSLTYLALITNTFYHLSSGLTSCSGFPCKWTVDNYALDLTPFQFIGVNLTTTDNNGNDYYFTPCNNLLYGYAYYQYMAVKMSPQQVPTYLAPFTNTIKPTVTLDSNNQPIWNFTYTNNFTVEYICNYNLGPDTYMEFTDVLEIFPGSYLFRISSYYICDNVTVTNDIAADACMWHDDTDTYLLDLRPLFATQITTSSYNLYVCQNAYRRTSGVCTSTGCCAMYGGSSSAYGLSDPIVKPTYDVALTEWTFEYPRTKSNTFTLKWICDATVTNYVVRSASSSSMTIATFYACPAELRCIFDDPNGDDQLNLQALSGTDIRYIDNNNLLYSFEYSVCQNNLLCNNNETSSMAIRWNINEQKCDPYLAIWDGINGYDLSYDIGSKQWKFSYYNGEYCLSFQRNTTFNIYWTCNQTVSNYVVTDVLTIDRCAFAMYIDSSYAC